MEKGCLDSHFNKCLKKVPKLLSAQTCSSDIQRRENSRLIHCPTLHTSLLLYSSPFDNSSLSQAVIVPHLCQLVAQPLSFPVGFQTPLQRCRGWEFGRGLILNLAVESQLRQTGSPRPRPDALGGTNTPSSRRRTISGRGLNCPWLHPRGFPWLPPSNPPKLT